MSDDATQYFRVLDELVRTSKVVIDRPRGTAHPRYPRAIYPLDYGFLAGTTGGDGEGVDVFVGTDAGVGVVAVVLTADVRKRDVETKVLLDCTAAEINAVRGFLADSLGLAGHFVLREGHARTVASIGMP
ncbi:inorganic pyrophosphatase [Tsukamurella pseudospumae]|uniref:Inorganic pyrophosphatase n=1 Tax=Tsukamurella pseudospumae TaxID=239498 RepID=A0A138A866_9ACTN|nr:inorganic pyrophosphatase [Tsukamurella pseudospumae]KXP00638.1 inorganic pyrophosphatase [Tsukamurella pseudospumae]KXP06659.1 inorganic pyrophosphatase [Tsukamurella pseudospumae]